MSTKPSRGMSAIINGILALSFFTIVALAILAAYSKYDAGICITSNLCTEYAEVKDLLALAALVGLVWIVRSPDSVSGPLKGATVVILGLFVLSSVFSENFSFREEPNEPAVEEPLVIRVRQTIESVPAISLGEEYSFSTPIILTNRGVGAVFFDLHNAAKLQIELRGGYESDPYLEIYRGTSFDNLELVIVDDDSDAALDAFVRQPFDAGRYYVLVEDLNYPSSYQPQQPFTLQITEWSLEDNVPSERTVLLSTADGEESFFYKGKTNVAGQGGKFLVAVALSDVETCLIVDVDPLNGQDSDVSSGDTIVLLYDENYEVVDSNDDINAADLGSRIIQTIPSGAPNSELRYVVEVSGYDGDTLFDVVIEYRKVDAGGLCPTIAEYNRPN